MQKIHVIQSVEIQQCRYAECRHTEFRGALPTR
jgi:hypothetical protein